MSLLCACAVPSNLQCGEGGSTCVYYCVGISRAAATQVTSILSRTPGKKGQNYYS